ncbi:hypothetical protein ACQPW1_10405 [Nocardia sp. CA-128927]|uniref:hypothetical protein n=1 Tax=Nocardia sp. CA-128927 TaxID=3239975 RepID=UPI003D95E1E9
MTYAREDLDAFHAAADAANQYTPFEIGDVEFAAAAEALLSHVYKAIHYLAGVVDDHSTSELHAHILELMRAGHTQAAIAKASAVSTTTISRIVNNSTARYAPDVAARLLAVPVTKPEPPPLNPSILAALERGEQVSVPFGYKARYAEALARTGVDTKRIANSLNMSYAQAIKAKRAAA